MSEENSLQGTCKFCKGQFRFSNRGAGKEIRCPHCQMRIVLRGIENVGFWTWVFRGGEPNSKKCTNEFLLWINEKKEGPYTLEDLQSKLKKGEITARTLFSEKDDSKWEPLDTIIEQLSKLDYPTVDISKVETTPSDKTIRPEDGNMDDKSLSRGVCPRCKGPFKFPKQRVDQNVVCPHCQETVVLKNEGINSSEDTTKRRHNYRRWIYAIALFCLLGTLAVDGDFGSYANLSAFLKNGLRREKKGLTGKWRLYTDGSGGGIVITIKDNDGELKCTATNSPEYIIDFYGQRLDQELSCSMKIHLIRESVPTFADYNFKGKIINPDSMLARYTGIFDR